MRIASTARFRRRLFCATSQRKASLPSQQFKWSLLYGSHEIVFSEGRACVGSLRAVYGQGEVNTVLGTQTASDTAHPGCTRDGRKHAIHDGAIEAVSCETVEPCQIGLLDRRACLTLARSLSTPAVKLIQLLSQELGRHKDLLNQFTFKTVRKRVAEWLLDLGGRPEG